MRLLITTLLLSTIILVSPCILTGQSVGVVLSGGGAKGLAHIGVLKALEEEGIPIDYISGTSMGAIVGAMYAAGYSPEEIERLAKSPDFQDWATGRIPDEYQFNYKRRDESASLFSFNIAREETGPVPRLPTNIVSTHLMDLVLLELLAPASAAANYNFDSLFVPFRCVAADVYNNKPVILKEGQLSTAVRASSAFPFVFSPVTINNTLLFDGGIYNNFPYEILIEDFEADLVIGSKTAANPPKPTEENIVLQIENMIAGQTDYDLSKVNGILIETELDEVGVLDFHLARSVIQNGYRAALKHVDYIKERIYRNVSEERLEERRKDFNNKMSELKFNDIYVQGATEDQEEFIQHSFGIREGFFDFDLLERSYFKLVADDNISSLFPEAYFNEESNAYDLHLRLRADRELELQLGGNISSEFNQGYAGANYRVLGRNSYNLKGNVYFGRLYTSAMVKGQVELPRETPLFADVSLNFNRWDYFTGSPDPFFEDIMHPYLMHYDGNLRVSIGTAFSANNFAELIYSLGRTSYHYYQVQGYTQADTADVTDLDLNSLSLSYEMNTLDRKHFPSSGSNFRLKAQFAAGNESFQHGSVPPTRQNYKDNHYYLKLHAKYKNYRNISSNFRLGLYGEGVISNMPFFGNYTSTIFHAPVFQPTPHSRTLFLENYRAHSFVSAGMIPVFRIRDSFHFRLGAYIFQPYKHIHEDENYKPVYSESFTNPRFTGNAALVYHTPLGPASLSVNYYKRDGKQFCFLFSFGYIMFNDKTGE